MKTKQTFKLLEIAKLFAKMTGNDRLELQTMQTFLMICSHGGEVPQAELEKLLGMAQSTLSRNVARLGIGQSPDEPGPRLIAAEEDPYHRRRKIVRLTERGKKLCEDLTLLMER